MQWVTAIAGERRKHIGEIGRIAIVGRSSQQSWLLQLGMAQENPRELQAGITRRTQQRGC
jgi:hypothetical protein